MSDVSPKTLNHFTLFKFTPAYYELENQPRSKFQQDFLGSLQTAGESLELYQLSPTSTRGDILAWSALEADDPQAAKKFFAAYSQATNPFRSLMSNIQICNTTAKAVSQTH